MNRYTIITFATLILTTTACGTIEVTSRNSTGNPNVVTDGNLTMPSPDPTQAFVQASARPQTVSCAFDLDGNHFTYVVEVGESVNVSLDSNAVSATQSWQTITTDGAYGTIAIPYQMKLYERDAHGAYVYDANGAIVVVDTNGQLTVSSARNDGVRLSVAYRTDATGQQPMYFALESQCTQTYR